MVTDQIRVTGLVVECLVGVLPHERTTPQDLRVDLELHVDTRLGAATDNINDTAHYGYVAEGVAQLMRDSRFFLLESLAQSIADHVLLIDRVEAVDVTLTKLDPPIDERLDHTGVRIMRHHVGPGSHRSILALGSNLGDRESHLRAALASLPPVVAQSDVYETAPVGGPDNQGAYLNMVVAVDTDLDPYALLRRCQGIELSRHRVRAVRWGPRTLDIDILFYDSASIRDQNLTIPHQRINQRRFVLTPLSDVAPNLCPPNWDETLPPDEVTSLGPLT